MIAVVESQAELWNGASGERWTREQERLDRAFESIDRIALEAAAATTGERAIDIGCGCGTTTLQLAERVGPTGSVLGVDISVPMLARAKERAAALPWVELTLGDAARYPFEKSADLLYSRFGVMFFDAPREAFAHLKSGLRKGGRVCFAIWRAPEENPWLMLPLRAAERVLPPAPPPPEGGPGPFSLAAESTTHALFAAAGFTDVELVPHDVEISLSTTGLEDAVDFALNAGPIARRVASVDGATVERVYDAVTEVLAKHGNGQSVTLPGGIWLARSRA